MEVAPVRLSLRSTQRSLANLPLHLPPVQIVPKLVPLVKQLDTFIRTKTWIALPFTSGKITSAAVSKNASLDPLAALVDPQT